MMPRIGYYEKQWVGILTEPDYRIGYAIWTTLLGAAPLGLLGQRPSSC